jgi:hypothetical protein
VLRHGFFKDLKKKLSIFLKKGTFEKYYFLKKKLPQKKTALKGLL